MKGIVLAGGYGTRLYPITKGISKQLLPIYDKPMIYYPISTLMEAGINDILIISTPTDISNFEHLLGDGSNYGISLTYKVQSTPNGIAEAFIIGESFIGNDDVCLILGDNIFHGSNFKKNLKNARKLVEDGYSSVFGYRVNDPERYGVVEFDEQGKCLSIEEKPKNPKSNYAVVGIYFYTNDVIKRVKNITPSARGELEITALNQNYLKDNKLIVEILPRGFVWLDTGTFGSLNDASNYVKTIEMRQGIQIACLEEIAFKNKWINSNTLKKIISQLGENDYKKYLNNILK